MNKTAYHESAILHTTGKATYTDDIPKLHNELQGYIVTSPVARGILKSFDFSEALKLPGVVAILSHNDIPGEKKIGAIIHDEPVLVEKEISYKGQPLFLIAAENLEIAYQAAQKIKFEIQQLEPITTIEQAMKLDWKLAPTRYIKRGDPEKIFKSAPNLIEGTFSPQFQEHWYLETHAAIAIPLEHNEIKILSSTQNPTEVQMLVAKVLNIPFNEVEVEVKRLGGGFGGKEAQASNFAVLAALMAWYTKRPVRLRLERQIDQLITGKRHQFIINYKVAFDNQGKILAAKIDLNGNAGAFADLSMPILERAMLHAENAYFIPHIEITGTMWKTNLPPNTAFRGFGAPQAIFNIERIIHIIAKKLNKDPNDIRKINFYSDQNNQNITPYGQKVENNRLHIIFNQLIQKANYYQRKKDIQKFNEKNKFKKRGIALIPVKFGISFTASFLNQAGALVNVYTDGSVLVNHGGVEMGQGLHTKIQQIAAAEFGIDINKVKVNATNTSKVPNTPPTAASTGSDMNGMAVKDAIDKIKSRISNALAEHFNKSNLEDPSYPTDFVFENNEIYDKKHPQRRITFAEAAALMRLMRVSLSATGYYKTPGVYFDREKGQGHPFYYYAFGMAISEVEVDLLTGEVTVIRTDILHDVGDSLNPNIDIGQIEGGFIQGMGWTWLEMLQYTPDGSLLQNSPSTYKIPAASDIPKQFNVELLKGYPQPGTIKRSKAVGEPPFILGISVWLAIFEALGNAALYLQTPATNDNIILALEQAKIKNLQPAEIA